MTDQEKRWPQPDVESRDVLAACYLGPNKSLERMRSHAVIVDENKHAVSVLCSRVSFDSLADRNGSDPLSPPTCEACLRALRRRIVA